MAIHLLEGCQSIHHTPQPNTPVKEAEVQQCSAGDRACPADDTAGQEVRVLPSHLLLQSILSDYFYFPIKLSPQSICGLSPASKQLRLSLFNQHQGFLGIWQAWKHSSWHFPSRQHLSYLREDHKGWAVLLLCRISWLCMKNHSQVSNLPTPSAMEDGCQKTCLTFTPDPGNSKPLHVAASYPTTTMSDMRLSWGTRGEQ